MSPDIYGPDSDEYRRATRPRNAAVVQRPAFVTVPSDAAEVAAVIEHCRRVGVVAVPQATGHGAGTRIDSGTAIIDCRRLDGIEIDATARTARAGAGATWGAVDALAVSTGLLGRAGSAPSVGIAGYTFGGGIGWLVRPHGTAAGALRGVEFVDGHGTIRYAHDDATDQADKQAMYAFRGGGGVGVATRLDFDLVPVHDLWAGMMLWPADQLDAVVAAWAQAIPEIGPSLATSIAVLTAPPSPGIPGDVQGRRVVHLAMASTAGPRHAAPLMGALRAAPTPALDTWGPSDVDRLGTIHLDPPQPVPGVGIARWLNASAPDIALTALSSAVDAALEMVEIRHVENNGHALPGAMSEPAGPFILHAVGDHTVPTGRGRGFDQMLRAARPSDTGLSLGSWLDGRSTAPDALPTKVREQVEAIRRSIDPDDVIGRTRITALA